MPNFSLPTRRAALILAIGVVAATLGFMASADADQLSFTAAADTWVDQNAPTSVAGGTATTLDIAQATKLKRAFLRFDVAGIPAGATGVTATVDLTTRTSMTKTIELHALNTGQTFAEATTNWNNQPTFSTTILGTGCCKATGVRFSIPAGNVTGNGTWYFAVINKTTQNGSESLQSREGTPDTDDPKLTVTYTTTSTTTSTTLPPGCTGVPVTTADNVQQLLDQNPTGTTFCLAAGRYRLTTQLNPQQGQRLVGALGAILDGSKTITSWTPSGSNFVGARVTTAPANTNGTCRVAGCTYVNDVFLDGAPLVRVTSLAALAPGKFYEDFTTNQVYLRDNPTGHTIDQAYASRLVGGTATGVTVTNLVAEKAANPAQTAAVQAADAGGWTLSYNEVRYNHGMGLAHANSYAAHNNVHHNGQLGMGGAGTGHTAEYNEIAFNNRVGYDPFWEAGGTKWANTTNLTIRGNYSHDNGGPGLWTDIDNQGTLYENNDVRNNEIGITDEISCGAIIRNNVAVNNTVGGVYAGIFVHNSQNVEAYGNTVMGDSLGIYGHHADRGSGRCAYEVRNLNVHDNNVTATIDRAGGISDHSTLQDPYDPSFNNHWELNHYHFDSLTANRFAWNNVIVNFTTWQGFGHDDTGTLDTTIPAVPSPPTLVVGPQP